MRFIEAGVLKVAYRESGPPDGTPVILLHGFPYDSHAYDDVADRLSAKGMRCLVPCLRGYGDTRFLSPETMRSGQQAALGADLLAFMDALSIGRAVLGGYDWGGRAACIAAALWPARVAGLVSCGQGYNIQDIAGGSRPAPPADEIRLWYQFYLNTERGHAGLTENRYAFCRQLWMMWSPTWRFDEETYARTAASFDNPDFVDVVVHSYRHRFGSVPGDRSLDPIEVMLAARPKIAVPACLLDGRDDGVGPPSPEDKHRTQFTGRYERRIVDGVGHNVPQEAPEAFASAILDLALL